MANRPRSPLLRAATIILLTLGGLSAVHSAASQTIVEVFESAWQRQAEALVLQTRIEAAKAKIASSKMATAGAPSAELSMSSDQANQNTGNRSVGIGLALPLWLPSEKLRSLALAQAELDLLDAQRNASRLRLAAIVRERYWAWYRTQGELQAANARIAKAQVLAADVSKRVRAGDLARADQHQAEGAVAAANAARAEVNARAALAAADLQALTGGSMPMPEQSLPETLPKLEAQSSLEAGNVANQQHPQMLELDQRTVLSQRNLELISVQNRSNSELTFGASSARDQFSAPYRTNLNISLRIPLGIDPRNRSRLLNAQADLDEFKAVKALVQQRISADIVASRARIESLEMQREAAKLRARLANETRGFFEKSFLVGESDLPTRLRIELEAFEAERQALRAELDYVATISELRQALGLMPVAADPVAPRPALLKDKP
jgi:outer membrane protein, heavy metal efflux system